MYAVIEEKKICSVCGCSFLLRRRWKDNWPEVKYCGERCARRRLSSFDREVEEAIPLLLDRQAPGATISPTEVSQYLDRSSWQSIEEATRMAACRLVRQGKIEIVHEGKVIDPDEAEGVVRLRLPSTKSVRDEALAS